MFDFTMAQATGDQPYAPLDYTPGTDFDPYDDQEVELVREAVSRDRQERASARISDLEAENQRLRVLLEALDPNNY